MEVTNDQRNFALEQAEGHDVIVIAEERDHDAWRQVVAARAPGTAGTDPVRLFTPAQAATDPTLSLDGRVLIVDELDRGVNLPSGRRSAGPVLAVMLGADVLRAGAPPAQLAERIRRRPELATVSWTN